MRKVWRKRGNLESGKGKGRRGEWRDRVKKKDAMAIKGGWWGKKCRMLNKERGWSEKRGWGYVKWGTQCIYCKVGGGGEGNLIMI